MVLAMVIVLSVASVAFADVSLTVNAVEGHSYKYWQLFVGDLADDGKTLSNVKWGSNAAASIPYKKASGSNEFTVDATIAPTTGAAVPAAVLEYLASLASDTLATANTITAWVTGNGTAIGDNTEVPTGYYVIKDSYTDPSVAHDTTLSTNVVEIVGPTQITPKVGTFKATVTAK